MMRATRRGLLIGSAGLLAGCDQLQRNASVRDLLQAGEAASMGAQRLLMSAQPLAREFKASDLSPTFRTNGSVRVDGAEYQRHAEEGFANWRLRIDGLVKQSLDLSLAQLRAMNARTQITRHDCVEGWSAIAQWTGVPLRPILTAAGLQPGARFIIFHCADNLGGGAGGMYYESIDLFDAFHPQTILAYALNGKELPIGNGAPLRLRVERQLGYKQAKFVMRIEAASGLAHVGAGKGGFWEDRGYEWYAGI